MKNWFFSKKNIYACLAISASLSIYLLGFIDKFWWLIAIFSYVITYIATPKELSQTISIDPVSLSLDKSEQQLVNLINESDKMLPQEALEVLHHIQINLNDLHFFIRKNDKFMLPMEEFYSIENIFENYLPNIVKSYIKFPKRYAETAKIKNNQTIKDVLIEQLTLLHEQLQKMSYSIYESDAKSMIIHGKFLQEKFSSNEWDSWVGENNKEMNA